VKARVAVGLVMIATLLPARANEELPPRIQAALFCKVFLYEKELGHRAPRVVVLTGNVSSGRGEDVVRAFSEAGADASGAEWGGRLPTVDRGTIIYAFPDVPSLELRRLATDAGALTISGDAGMALSSRVSVALRRKPDGHPEILVNLPLIRSERRELSSALLHLATVIRGPDAVAPRPSP
jgi:hypothetical protein